MPAKRIIPCLDVKNGQTVKGVNFENLRYAGDAVELAKKYSETGADELVFLDITATNEERKTTVEMVQKVAKQVFIPFTVGGGIKSIEDIKRLLTAGSDKVAINSAAVNNPDIIKGFVNSIQKGLDYTYSHTPKEIANVISKYFPDTSLNDLEKIVKRYIDIDSWYKTTYIDENDFNHVQEIMENSKQLDKKAPYDKLINNKYSKKL